MQEEQQRIALEVEESYLNLVEAGERIKAHEAQKRSAKENLELANGRYQVGVGSIIEITEAQVDQQRGLRRTIFGPSMTTNSPRHASPAPWAGASAFNP